MNSKGREWLSVFIVRGSSINLCKPLPDFQSLLFDLKVSTNETVAVTGEFSLVILINSIIMNFEVSIGLWDNGIFLNDVSFHCDGLQVQCTLWSDE